MPMPWTDAALAVESTNESAITFAIQIAIESDADSEPVRYAFAIIMKPDHSLDAQRVRLSRTSHRLLFGAVLASLLLHLTLVFGWGWLSPWVQPQPSAGSLQAIQVVVSARPATPAVAHSLASASANAPPRQPAPKPIVETRASPVLAMPTVEKAATAPDTTPSPAPLASKLKSSPDSPVAALTTGLDSTRVPVPPAGDPVSADGLRQYRIELASAARRFRHYPAMARSRGWEGVSEIVVSVNIGVPTPAVKLQRSSGNALLDEQAIEMLARAVAATPLPESLRNRSFTMPMPIRFSLEE